VSRRILIVEDDDATAAYLDKGLTEEGFVTERARTGREGLYLATSGSFDLIVLDRMLPELDGIAVLEALRAAKVSVPVLVLSALGNVDDRVRGLKAGGDDYLVKPFSFAELTARIEVLLRRPGVVEETVALECGDLRMDLLTRRVTRAGRPIELLPREWKLLEYLLRHKDRIVTRTMLLDGVWQQRFDPGTNVIDVHVSRLRQKVDHGFAAPLIHTVRGVGYRLSESPR
jgi:two-component system OmpR family response regulator